MVQSDQNKGKWLATVLMTSDRIMGVASILQKNANLLHLGYKKKDNEKSCSK